ncbi:gamma-glutamylcyclotransferase family protein [Brevirhabdus sp.]|uniref:gamma-glutamylcyclotransferase family protein n=1 Tax=Brevirhabdus sp. TaxID=2004514 RepID=UPI004058A87D
MTDPYFFGYGSLVNRRTHAYTDAHPARIGGWRRAWRQTGIRPAAFLTAVPDRDSQIDGLIAGVPGADWAALDLREHAYSRLPTGAAVIHSLPRSLDVQIYSVVDKYLGDDRHPILLSYLDVVVQGYLTEFGEAGAAAFFDTTDGWHTPILNDRAAPLYPRHQSLRPEETDQVDGWLKKLGATITTVG